jgi:hypothetical protein
VLNWYLKNYVDVDHKDWGDHLGLEEFCYYSTMHMVMKMSMFELALGKEAKKPMDLAIPMGKRDHSKKVVEMVKGLEELYAGTKKLLEKPKSNMKNMLTK